MPDWIFKNKPPAYATLASPSGTSGTTLTLTTGHGTRLPAPGAGQISAVRIENELITYTGNSGDVLTGVTRGAGATNHAAGTEVKNVLVEEWANAVTALSTDTKAALAGTSGTPQAANPYVTDADPRNSNARIPTAHGHVESETTGLVADLAARVLSTDSRLSDARTPTAHAISHKATGGDVLAGIVGGYAPLDSGLLVPVANLGTGTPTGLKFLRDDRVWAVPAGGGGGSLTIEEADGTPSVAAATKLILPNGTVSVSGTEATYVPAGGGGGGGLYSAYLLYIDQKTAGTNGGTFTSGAWRTRDLNTEVVDTGGNGSVSSNQVTLAAGTYDVIGSAPAFNLSYHAARLYDITNSAVLLDGTGEFTQGGASVSTRSWVIGRIVLSGSTVIELQHYSAGTQGTNGFGVSANSGGISVAHEVYSRLAFYKV
jgi:hypothetical protein